MPVLSTLIARLREASKRPEVAGLIAHLADAQLSDAQAQELGAAIEAFGTSGKPTLAWTEAFGEITDGTLSYHLAAHFDEVWVQPSGGVAIVGTALTGVFARDGLAKLGVEAQFGQRHEFKSAPDTFLRSSMSEPQRDSYQRLADSLVEELAATVARRRGITPAEARVAIDAAPLTPQQALERKLIDQIGYRDEAYLAMRRRIAGSGHEETAEADLPELQLRFVHRWSRPKTDLLRERVERELARRGSSLVGRGKPGTLAVIPVEGGINLGASGGSPLGGASAGSDTICAAIRKARQDDEVAAIVLRVVSPGGSYTASDAIHREVALAREAGKPVVASMGTVAASGGYFVAMGADEIFALPTTLTGSIGVFAGKFVTAQAQAKLGVHRESVQAGAQATMWSSATPFDASQLERLDAWLDAVYDDFTQKAAAGRSMAHAELEPLARGRVWTGADAKERGLVDSLGGLSDALDAAAKLAGRSRDDLTAVRYPEIPPFARLMPANSSEAPNASLQALQLPGDEVRAVLGTLSAGPEQLLAQVATTLGLAPAGALSMAPLLRRASS